MQTYIFKKKHGKTNKKISYYIMGFASLKLRYLNYTDMKGMVHNTINRVEITFGKKIELLTQ